MQSVFLPEYGRAVHIPDKFRGICSFLRVSKIVIFISALLLSTSGPASAAAPVNDDQTNAILLPSLSNYSSGNAAFTTAQATPDQTAGSCWNTGPNFNVWFKFVATTATITIQVKNGGAFGTLRNPYLAVWDSALNEMGCQRYATATGTLELCLSGLSPGGLYYFSVDNFSNPANRGTFSLHVDDQPTYDFMEGAITLPSVSDWTSVLATYSTMDATPDRSAGNCWNTGPNFNRWFKFTATTSAATVQVISGGAYGTLRYPYVSIWDSSLNQMACGRYTTATGTIETGTVALSPGGSYYISVDNYNNTAYRGSFTLYVDDRPDYDFMEGALLIPSTSNWSSADAAYSTFGATPDRSAGSCWNTGPNFNRWFKFVAGTNTATVQVLSGGVYGTLRFPYVTIWDSVLNELSCAKYSVATGTLETSTMGLIPGGTYYISVDNFIAPGDRGTFSLHIDDQPTYDWMEGAILIPSTSNWSSADAEYSTMDATPDRAAGSCWNTGPNFNRWFKFVAGSSTAIVQVLTGGSYGTMRYSYVTLLDSALNEISCARYSSVTGTIETGSINLTPGGTYYITVDNYNNPAYRGTFSLHLNDQPTYDWMEGALLLPSTSNWSSADAAYSTTGATPDRSAGSCWNTGPNYNRWFKFYAGTNTAIVQVLSGGVYGTLRYPYVTLFDSALNEIACARYSAATGTLEASTMNLTPGGLYYITVDNYNNPNYDGSFSLHLDDQPTYDYMEGAKVIPSTSNWSSPNAAYSTVDATPDRSKGSCWNTGPNFNRWFTFTSTTDAISIHVISGGAYGTLRYPYIALWDSALNLVACMQYATATGTLELSTLGLLPGATYYFSVDNYNNVAYKGSFSLWIDDQPDYNFREGAIAIPSTNNWTSALAAYSTVYATADKSKGACWNTGPNFNRWFSFTASTSDITILVTSGGAYGTLRYPYVALWDTAGNLIACQMYATVRGALELSLMTLTPGTKYYISVDNYNNTAYRGSFTLSVDEHPSYNYLEGAITLTQFSSWTSAMAAYSTTYANADRSKGPCWTNGPNYNRWFKFHATMPEMTVSVINGGAWGTQQYAYVAVWDSSLNLISCGRWASATGTLSIIASGLSVTSLYYITVDNAVGNAGSFTLFLNGYNPLPVTLTSFTATPDNTGIELRWETASEINCDYFTVERSQDGTIYTGLLQQKGAGTTTETTAYDVRDDMPLNGTSFYRLLQTDYDGRTTAFDPVTVYRGNVQDGIQLLGAGPSPLNDHLNLRIQSLKKTNLELSITTLPGAVVVHAILPVEEGVHSYTLKNLEALSDGLYSVRLLHDGNQLASWRITKN